MTYIFLLVLITKYKGYVGNQKGSFFKRNFLDEQA